MNRSSKGILVSLLAIWAVGCSGMVETEEGIVESQDEALITKAPVAYAKCTSSPPKTCPDGSYYVNYPAGGSECYMCCAKGSSCDYSPACFADKYKTSAARAQSCYAYYKCTRDGGVWVWRCEMSDGTVRDYYF